MFVALSTMDEDEAGAALRKRIREVEADATLSVEDKAKARQAIMTEHFNRGAKGKAAASEAAAAEGGALAV